MDTRIGKFTARDGLQLHYEHWIPANPKATLFFVHGIGDHCRRYHPLVDYFVKRDYRVCLYDLRGNGQSEGRRAHVRRFNDFLDDLSDYLQFSLNSHHSQPLFLAGHSLGGQIVLNYLTQNPGRFQAACVCSPNIEIALTMPKWLENFCRLTYRLLPTLKLKGLTSPQLLSHDPVVLEKYRQDPLVTTYITLGLGAEVIKNLQTIYQLAHHIQTPLFLLHGREDHYCSVEGTKRFYQELRLDQKQLKIYEGKYHELLNEVGKEAIYADMENWLRGFLPA